MALQFPKVQTRLAEKAIEAIRGHIDGDITFDRISIRPFDAVVLNNVTITDDAPYHNDTIQGGRIIDTLFHAERVSATFNLKSVFHKRGLHFGTARVRNGFLYLVSGPLDEPSSKLNLTRIFRLKSSDDKPVNDNPIFDISKVEIEDFRFRLVNYSDSLEKISGAVDWNDMDVMISRLKGHRLKMRGPVMEGVCDELSFQEKSGYKVLDITGSAKVGNGRTIVRNVHINDAWSVIDAPSIIFTYDDTDSWSDFINAVRMDIKVNTSTVDLKSIGFFAPDLKKMSMLAEISAQYEGYVNDFSVKNVRLRTLDSSVSGKLEGRITGLPDSQGMITSVSLEDFKFTSKGLEQLLHGCIPGTRIPIGNYAPDDVFRFNGKISGPLNRLSVKCDASSASGSFAAMLDIRNLIDTKRELLIGGDLSTSSLDIGKILNIKELGPCTMHTYMNAVLGKTSQSLKIDSLIVDKFNALGYEYKNIAAAGIYANEAFDGKIVCSDPNLNFIFQGIFTPSASTKNAIYQFYANLGYADLHALNIDKREISRLSLQTSANFKMIDKKDILGNIDIRNLVLEDAHGTHNIGSVSISSHVNNDVNRIRLNSSFADGSYVGTGFFDSFLKDLKAVTTAREMPAMDRNDTARISGNNYRIALNLHDTKDILAFVVPGLYIADSTAINLDIDASGLMKGMVKSHRIAFMDKYIKGLGLNMTNANNELSCELLSDEIKIAPLSIKNSRLLMYANDNNIGAGLSYDNETEKSNSGEIYMRGELLRDDKDSLALKAEMLPSNIYLNSEGWSIGNSEIYLNRLGVKVNDLIIKNAQQSIKLYGGYSKHVADAMNLELDKFDISMLNTFMKDNYDLRGQLSGSAVLASPPGKEIGLQMDFRCDSTYFAGERAGALDVKCLGDDAGKAFNIALVNNIDGKKSIEGNARFIPKMKTLDGHLNLDSLNIGYAAPILADVFNVMQGHISGDISFTGPVDKLNIESDGLNIHNARLGVDFTKVIYNVDGKADIDSKGVYFENIGITDRFGARGSVNGSINWKHFADMRLDTHISCNEMEVLNIAEGRNPDFYGNIFATGTVNITGPTKAILIDVNANTAKSGNFNIPMTGEAAVKASNLLTFKTNNNPIAEDPYEELMSRFRKTADNEGNLGVRIHLNVNPDTEVLVEVDKETGNVLSGRGNGIIDIDVEPANDIFTLNGDYNITSGNYHFDALGIVRRDLMIQDGSTVKFNGDIMGSELDIKALYKTKTRIGTLIADTTSTTRRNVECILSIKDKLSSPRIGFGIEIPDLDPSTKAMVENALSTEDKVQKQFLSLLVSNNFLPDERSGIVNNTRVLNTTVAEIMSNQLNNILQTLNIPVDLGLDYQNSHGSDIFDVALSTALFDNRVIVNGTIGNRQYKTTNTNNEIVGDLDIEIKLDKPGSLRLNLFSHSADQYTSYLDNSQRNGVGLTYQREFNSFREFFRKLFTGKKKRKAEDAASELARQNEDKVKISIKEKKNGK